MFGRVSSGSPPIEKASFQNLKETKPLSISSWIVTERKIIEGDYSSESSKREKVDQLTFGGFELGGKGPKAIGHLSGVEFSCSLNFIVTQGSSAVTWGHHGHFTMK